MMEWILNKGLSLCNLCKKFVCLNYEHHTYIVIIIHVRVTDPGLTGMWLSVNILCLNSSVVRELAQRAGGVRVMVETWLFTICYITRPGWDLAFHHLLHHHQDERLIYWSNIFMYMSLIIRSHPVWHKKLCFYYWYIILQYVISLQCIISHEFILIIENSRKITNIHISYTTCTSL